MSSLGRVAKRISLSQSKPTTTRLAINASVDPGKRVTVPKMGEQVTSGLWKRIDRYSNEDLERAYRMDELAFGIINKYVNNILGTGCYIEAKKPKDAKLMQDWCDKAGIDWVFREVIRDLFVFGYSFIEKVHNKGGDKIVRLASIDTKTLDFQRDSFGNIRVDAWGLPLAFEQSLWTASKDIEKVIGKSKTNTSSGNSNNNPGGNTSNVDAIVPRDRIGFFRFFTTSGSVIGLSPLESIYNIITWRKNVDWAMGEGAFVYASPPIVVKAGSIDMPVSAEDLEGLSEEIGDIGPQSVFVFPWHVDVDRLESSRGMEELVNFSENFQKSICNGLFIHPALMGIGQVNARGIADLSAEWEKTVDGFRAILAKQIQNEILEPVAKQLGIKDIPTIKWKTSSPSIAMSRARRLSTYARGGLLSWSPELENSIRRDEGLPPMTPKDIEYKLQLLDLHPKPHELENKIKEVLSSLKEEEEDYE